MSPYISPNFPYFCPPRISEMHFASPRVPLDAPALLYCILGEHLVDIINYSYDKAST